jgi:hypothetical protein
MPWRFAFGRTRLRLCDNVPLAEPTLAFGDNKAYTTISQMAFVVFFRLKQQSITYLTGHVRSGYGVNRRFSDTMPLTRITSAFAGNNGVCHNQLDGVCHS